MRKSHMLSDIVAWMWSPNSGVGIMFSDQEMEPIMRLPAWSVAWLVYRVNLHSLGFSWCNFLANVHEHEEDPSDQMNKTLTGGICQFSLGKLWLTHQNCMLFWSWFCGLTLARLSPAPMAAYGCGDKGRGAPGNKFFCFLIETGLWVRDLSALCNWELIGKENLDFVTTSLC